MHLICSREPSPAVTTDTKPRRSRTAASRPMARSTGLRQPKPLLAIEPSAALRDQLIAEIPTSRTVMISPCGHTVACPPRTRSQPPTRNGSKQASRPSSRNSASLGSPQIPPRAFQRRSRIQMMALALQAHPATDAAASRRKPCACVTRTIANSCPPSHAWCAAAAPPTRTICALRSRGRSVARSATS